MKTVRKISRTGVKEYINAAEKIIYKSVKANYPDYWSEDVINPEFLKNLALLFNGRKIHTHGNILRTDWKIYRKRDTGAGDDNFTNIAFIINVRYHDGHKNEGVCFFETHIRDNEKNLFSGIKRVCQKNCVNPE